MCWGAGGVHRERGQWGGQVGQGTDLKGVVWGELQTTKCICGSVAVPSDIVNGELEVQHVPGPVGLLSQKVTLAKEILKGAVISVDVNWGTE